MSENKDVGDCLEIYEANFYEAQIDGSSRSAAIIAPHVMSLFPHIDSVTDVGCGAGTWLAEFKKLGVTSISGLDGGNAPEELLLIDQAEYHKVDFTKDFPEQLQADLAITLEVAEHLDEVHASSFVSNVCKISDLILFSAAVPGQGGTNHVNEKWPSYWLEMFSKKNYRFFDVLRGEFWNESRIDWWYRQNIFLVVNADCLELIEKLEVMSRYQNSVLDIVHPDLHKRSRDQLSAAWSAERKAWNEAKKAWNEVNLARDEVKKANLQIREHARESARLAAEIESLLNSYSWKLMSGPRKLTSYLRKLLS